MIKRFKVESPRCNTKYKEEFQIRIYLIYNPSDLAGHSIRFSGSGSPTVNPFKLDAIIYIKSDSVMFRGIERLV